MRQSDSEKREYLQHVIKKSVMEHNVPKQERQQQRKRRKVIRLIIIQFLPLFTLYHKLQKKIPQ